MFDNFFVSSLLIVCSKVLKLDIKYVLLIVWELPMYMEVYTSLRLNHSSLSVKPSVTCCVSHNLVASTYDVMHLCNIILPLSISVFPEYQLCQV